MSRTPRPPRSFWFAHVVRATVGNFLGLVFRVRLVGRENIPDGGVILAGNHISYADPMLLWCRSPRPTHFMAKSELWDSNILGWGLDHFWAFQVKRGQADRTAVVTASTYLKDGEQVGIFPEGTRNFDGSAEAQAGVAFLAIRNSVPVVPVGIAGTDRIMPPGSRLMHFPRIVISFGEAIGPESFTEGGRGERVAAMTGEIMRRIGEQVEVARRERER